MASYIIIRVEDKARADDFVHDFLAGQRDYQIGDEESAYHVLSQLADSQYDNVIALVEKEE